MTLGISLARRDLALVGLGFLVGALAPARMSESDAPFNLGMALATAQIAPPGVWITMNGTVFRAAEVVKDRAKGAFVAKPE